MNKYNQGKAKDTSSFFVKVFENIFSTKLNAFSERLKHPKDAPLVVCGVTSAWQKDIGKQSSELDTFTTQQ